MPQRAIRQDPLTGEHVVLASVRHRHAVPHPQPADDLREGVHLASCPFCPGNESATRETILAIEDDGAWVARAFANRCPILVVEAGLAYHHHGVFHGIDGFGAHEVLVESPDHVALHHQPPQRWASAFALAVGRLTDLRQDGRLKLLHWFRNHGPASGGSQRHPHAQVVGMPFVPERWQRYAGRARHHHASTGRTSLSHMLDDEVRDGRRILGSHGPVVALCPWAPSHPLEVWFVPENPGRGLADATDPELDGLATLMPPILRAIEAVGGGTLSYTATILGAAEGVDPTGVGWHLRVLPRLGHHGGIERGTGVMVHGVFPEEAAQALRRQLTVHHPVR